LLSAIPLALAAVGEAVGERAGLINLGAEGTMLTGAFAGFWVSYHTESLVLGLLAGAFAGLAAGALFGAIAVIVEADLVLLGLGFTLAGGGLTAFLFREEFGSGQPLLASSMSRPFNGIADTVPVIGPALLDQKWFFYAAWVIVAMMEILLRKTTIGLRIRAVGEAPAAVDAAGIGVSAIRMTAAIVAGTLTGLAGASLTIVELGFFLPNVTLGTGFIAIALAMLGRLSPWRIAIVAVLFGSLRGFGYGLQLVDISVQSDFARLLPYVGVVLALIVIGRGVRMPSKLGETYPRRRRSRHVS
jgi:simple sugar transport system permease protein